MSSPPLLRLAASGGYFALSLLFSLFRTSPLLQLQPESTFSGPLRQSAAGLEERTRIHGKKTLTLSLQQRVAPSFYCCVSVDWARWGVYSSLAGYHRKALSTSGIWNGIITMDIREPCPFLLVLPMFGWGIRLLAAFSAHCCKHTDTHVCMYVCYIYKKKLVRPWEVVCKHWTDAVQRAFVEIWHEGYGALFVIETSKALPAPFSLRSLAVVMSSPWFSKSVPLKVQSGHFLKDTWIVINDLIPTNVSPKPVTCLFEQWQMGQKRTLVLRSRLSENTMTHRKSSTRLSLEHTGVSLSIAPNLPFNFLSLAWPLAFRLNSFF